MKSDCKSRLTAWCKRNWTRIKWTAFLIPYGYWTADVAGAAAMAALIGVLVGIPLIGPMAKETLEQIKFRTGRKNTFTINGMEFIIEDRTTLVRIQKPKPLLMGLRVGGKMRGMGWKDVEVAKYETHPEGAIRQAVDDYDGYKVAGIREIDPDGDLSAFSQTNHEQIAESGWIEVNPERDLPDE